MRINTYLRIISIRTKLCIVRTFIDSDVLIYLPSVIFRIYLPDNFFEMYLPDDCVNMKPLVAKLEF